MVALLAFVSLAFAPSHLAAQNAAPRVIETQADATYQSAIADVAAATDRVAMDATITRLMSLNGGDVNRLVPQVLLYAARNDKAPATRAVVGHVIKRLEGKKESLVAALVPLLDDVDLRIQEQSRDLLRSCEDRSAVRPPDYTAYHAILEADFRALRPPQASLVKFMYEGDPGAALLALMRASQFRDPAELKPILWTEHVVADLLWRRQFGFVERNAVDPAVVRELDKLSQHTAWWARLYVAEIIRVHPELGTPAMRERLTRDSNVVVQQAMKKV